MVLLVVVVSSTPLPPTSHLWQELKWIMKLGLWLDHQSGEQLEEQTVIFKEARGFFSFSFFKTGIQYSPLLKIGGAWGGGGVLLFIF